MTVVRPSTHCHNSSSGVRSQPTVALSIPVCWGCSEQGCCLLPHPGCDVMWWHYEAPCPSLFQLAMPDLAPPEPYLCPNCGAAPGQHIDCHETDVPMVEPPAMAADLSLAHCSQQIHILCLGRGAASRLATGWDSVRGRAVCLVSEVGWCSPGSVSPCRQCQRPHIQHTHAHS